MARIYSDGSFMILGRKDNVINSGGIKIQAEEMTGLKKDSITITKSDDVYTIKWTSDDGKAKEATLTKNKDVKVKNQE